MKRKTYDETSWRAKLTEKGIKYLEEYRREKLEVREKGQNEGSVNFLDYLEKLSAPTKPTAETRTEFTEYLSQNPAAKEQYDKLTAEILGPIPPPSAKELWNVIYGTLEQTGQNGRLALSMMLAIGVHNFWGLYYDVRKRHFGNSPINTREFCWILGTAFQNYANILRTGDFEMATKGRVNTELLDLIRKIKQYEAMRLTYRELRDALIYVLVFTPNEGELRLYVHRAKKKGWL